MMKWTNEITRLLTIQYPIIQAPMFGVSTSEMVMAANNANALGSLALGDVSYDKCVQLIRNTKTLTNRPFAVNIFLHSIPAISDELKIQYNETKLFIENLAKQHQLETVLSDFDVIKLTDYHDQIDAIIIEKCKIVSFTFGVPDEQSIQKLKDNNVILIGTCTSIEEAIVLENLGIDIICVQGIEAGGHRGSFAPENIPKIGGMSLLAQVYDKVKTPLIYGGGIYDAKTLLAAKTLGAQGFQIGSLLLGSVESELTAFEKSRLRKTKESEIILTKSFSGRYARGIKNLFTEALDNSAYILPYPYQNKLTAELRKSAKMNNNADFVSIWVGQSLNSFSGASTTDIISDLITKVEKYDKDY